MAVIKPFKCVRPNEKIVSKVAALPYDVYNREEALEVVKKEKFSFLKIDRAETQFPTSVSTYDPVVYQKAKELFNQMIQDKILTEDNEEAYYIYELIMDKRSQNGIVATSSINDYIGNVIRKHEKTREDKEIDRINHVDILDAQTGPIFLAYRKNDILTEVIKQTKQTKPLYAFTSNDKITHNVWKISDKKTLDLITKTFAKIKNTYIADGHHRCASAVKVGLKRREQNPGFSGKEPFNYFLSVLFSDNELMILPYNRCVLDLNNHSIEEFLSKIESNFTLTKCGKKPISPKLKGEIGMYLDNTWYLLKAHDNLLKINDPVLGLDVSLLQDYILNPILGIKDPRVDKRIDFIGGIRGIKELEKRVNTDSKVAFLMYPTQIKELFDVADANLLMPPKSTWFEPKLRSGIFSHRLK